MKEEFKDLWIVAGLGMESVGLFNGTEEFYDLEIGRSEHKDLCEKFAKQYNINVSHCNSHEDFGKLFTSLGCIMLVNIGNIDRKRACVIYLPPQMTEKQLAFLEDRKQLFYEKFHHNVSLFDFAVLSDRELEYCTNNGFRNLEIESIIENNPSKDGQVLLYREVERQKINLIEKKR